MTATIIDGKAVAAEIRAGITEKAKTLPRKACLAVIVAGDDPASAVYVRNKK
ncbi:MAG TPA: tetrahydrofolate dehydrogenase/cyclohydrolase catalytic domain-containing protein, partial [Bacillota bacterium]|nr:tetrahydrofolate dehydrogenase/cyclohydrolase catalytic domain-containing protein [Bacillota bacterium]